jgi:acyl-CoA reductase-like NAD-dependent aldehyde dehydrogenase
LFSTLQFHNLLNHVISGLFSGNAVVCKVSEYTSWSAIVFEKIIHEALKANGHSTDLVQLITGFGDAGAALVQCPLVDKVIFTGSPAVGRKVMEGASKVLKPVVLELGGKDPMVFCEDVNIKVCLIYLLIFYCRKLNLKLLYSSPTPFFSNPPPLLFFVCL